MYVFGKEMIRHYTVAENVFKIHFVQKRKYKGVNCKKKIEFPPECYF